MQKLVKMTRKYQLLFLFGIFLPLQLCAQNWQVNLNINPYPSPWLSQWQVDPTLASLEIQNLTNKPDVVWAELSISSDNGTLAFFGTSRRILANPNELLFLNNTGLTDWNTSAIQNSYKETALRTGMLPEGDYEVCITLKNQWNTILAQDVCGFFTIVHPDAPELIYPIDDEIIFNEHPIFQWLPPFIPNDLQIFYSLRIVELFDGQTANMAIEGNYPHYETDLLTYSTFEYPFDALPLEAGKTYVWRIRALDIDGKPLTKNDGFSYFGTFKLENPLEQILTLIAPEDQAEIFSDHPTFSWEGVYNPLGNIANYFIKVVEIPPASNLLAPEAIKYGWPIWQAQTTGTEISIPLNEPGLLYDKIYAWQVQALDEAGQPIAANNGYSEARSFTVNLDTENINDDSPQLPDLLPLNDESIAYLQLKQNGQPLVDYQIDGDQIIVNFDNGKANLYLPAFSSALTNNQPVVNQLAGSLMIDKNSLQILSGHFASQNINLDLSETGLPFNLTELEYDATSKFDFKGALFLFDQTLTPADMITATLDETGQFCAQVPTMRIDRTFNLVQNSDAVQLFIRKIEVAGNQLCTILPGDIEPQIALKSKIRIKAFPLTQETNSNSKLAAQPDYIISNINMVTNGTSFSINRQATELTFGLKPSDNRELIVSNILLNELNYYNGYGFPWSFQFTCDLENMLLDFHELNIPPVTNIFMTEKGLEIPYNDVAIHNSNWLSSNDVLVKPYAYRQPAFTFNWYNEYVVTNWPDRFDIEIDLNLPNRLSELDVPFTANNVLWENGAFKGAWNRREFLSPRFAAFNEQRSCGLLVSELTGEFASSSTQISTQADLVLSTDSIDSLQVITLPSPIAMDYDGIFTTQTDIIKAPQAFTWGDNGLVIQPKQNISVEMNPNNGVQNALLKFNGKISLPSCDGQTATASGRGEFDIVKDTLNPVQFKFDSDYTLCLPTQKPVFRFITNRAQINSAGLLFPDGQNEMILGDDSRLTCTFQNDFSLALPSFQITAGEITFDNPFAIELENFYGTAENIEWKTLPFDAENLTSENDHVFLNFPDNVQINNGVLLATGNTQNAHLLVRGQTHSCTTEFSDDFNFDISILAVSAGRIDFVKDDETIAWLDKDGLNLGEYFGTELIAEQIILPNADIAHITLSEEVVSKLNLSKSGEYVQISTIPNETVPLTLPALAYGSDAPTVNISLDSILVDPRTGLVQATENLKFDLSTEVNLENAGIPLELSLLTFTTESKLEATLAPILPPVFQDVELNVNAPLTASGLATINENFNQFQATESPMDSVVHGPTLTTIFDGWYFNAYNKTVKISGNFKTPLFNKPSLHFITNLSPGNVEFVSPPGTNYSFTTNCTEIELLEQDGKLFTVTAPFDQNDIEFSCSATMLFSNGFYVSLENIQIDGTNISSSSTNGSQESHLFGSEITIDNVSPILNKQGILNILCDGSLKLFDNEYDYSNFQISTNCDIKDATLFTTTDSTSQNNALFAQEIATKNGQLKVSGKIPLPDPFTPFNAPFEIILDKNGDWLKNGNAITEYTAVNEENEAGIESELGTYDQGAIHVPIKLAHLTMNKTAKGNSAFNGSIELAANAYWPNLVQDQLWQVKATITSVNGKRQVEWSVPSEQIGQDDTNPETFAIRMEVFNDVYDLSADLVNDSLVVTFTHNSGFPDNAIIIGGELEFKENILRRDYFERGRFSGCEFNLLVFNISVKNVEFYKAKGDEYKEVDISDITFNANTTNVEEKTIHATTYYSFSDAILDGDFMKASGGVEEFRWIDGVDPADNKERQILFIENAHIKLPDLFNARIDLLADIKDAQEFKFLCAGTASFEGFKDASKNNSGTLVGIVEMNDNLPGFGGFLSGNFKPAVSLAPIPAELSGLGGGIFVNVDSEVDQIIRKHLGLDTDSVDPEFVQLLSEQRGSDPRSFGKIMFYSKINIPTLDAGIECRSLITAATDRIRFDLKVTGIENEDLKKYMTFYGLGFVEAAVEQDLSGFNYLAGNMKVGSTPKAAGCLGVDDPGYVTKSLISFPDMGGFYFKVVLAPGTTGNGAWAFAGQKRVKTPFFYNEMDAEIALSNYGFYTRGKYAIGFDLAIIRAETGLELALYVYHEPGGNVYEWGGYGNAYTEAAILGDWLASARGDMYVGMFAENADDFYLFGTAMLEATVLGVSKEFGVWAKWETGGGFEAGTGIDEEMLGRIADCQDKATEIFEAALGLDGIDMEYDDSNIAELDETIYQMVLDRKDKDFCEYTINELSVVTPQIGANHAATLGYLSELYTNLTGTKYKDFRAFAFEWEQDLKYAAAGRWQEISEALQISLVNQRLSNMHFALDTLAAKAELIRIDHMYNEESQNIAGINVPYAKIDTKIQNDNETKTNDFLKIKNTLSNYTWNQIKNINQARSQLYEGLAGDSPQSMGNIIAQNHQQIDISRMTGQTSLTHQQVKSRLRAMYDVHTNIKARFQNLGETPISKSEIESAIEYEWRRVATDDKRQIYLNRKTFIGKNYGSYNETNYKNLAYDVYYTAPFLLLKAYSTQIAKISNSLYDHWETGLEQFDQAAVQFTQKTNSIWDKYFDLSEKFYSIVNDYKPLSGTELQQASQDSLLTIDNALSNEFIYPEMSISTNVTNPQIRSYFRTFSLDLTNESNNINWAEVQIKPESNKDYFSIGTLTNYNRHYFFHPDVRYINVSTLDEKFLTRSTKDKAINAELKIRNKAGRLTKWPDIYKATLSFYSPNEYAPDRNNITVQTPQDTVLDISPVIPTAFYDIQNDKLMSGPIDSLFLEWDCPRQKTPLVSSFDLEISTPSGLQNTYQIGPVETENHNAYTGQLNGFMPETIKMTKFSTMLDGLNLDQHGYHRLILRGYGLDGSLIHQGMTTLIIDPSPPRWFDRNMSLEKGENWNAWLILPKAKDRYIGLNQMVKGYQVRLIHELNPPQTAPWVDIEKFPIIKNQGITEKINLGSLPYQRNFAIEVRSFNTLWKSGYSNLLGFGSNRLLETDPPIPAVFSFDSINELGNTFVTVKSQPSDSLSGLKRMAFRIARVQGAQTALWKSPLFRIDISPDDLVEDLKVELKSESLKDELYGKLVYYIYTVDNDENSDSCLVTTLLHPRPPQNIVFYLDDGYLTVKGEYDRTMIQDYVREFHINVSNGTASSDFTIPFYQNNTEWYKSSATRPFEYRFDVSALLTSNNSLEINYKAQNYNFYLDRTQFSPGQRYVVDQFQPIFSTVKTGENGSLIIQIKNEAFDGKRQADYFVAVGKLQNGNPTFDIKPFPTAPDYKSFQIQAETELELPVEVNECYAQTLIAIKAVASNGEIMQTNRSAALTPKAPWLATAPQISLKNNNYILKISLNDLDKIYKPQNGSGALICSLHANVGDEALKAWTIKLTSNDQQSIQKINITDIARGASELYLSIKGETAAGQTSEDNSLYRIIVPTE